MTDVAQQALLDAVQEYVNDHEGGGLVTAAVLSIEVARADGNDRLKHRYVDAEAGKPAPWRALGMVYALLSDCTGWVQQTTRPSPDRDPDDE